MVTLFNKTLFGIVLFGLLSACAGFREGYESLAYIDNAEQLPKQRGPGYMPPHAVPWNGLTLRVALNNTLQTSDHTVMLFVVPTSVDPFDKFVGPEAQSRLTVFFDVKGADNHEFDPSKAQFVVDGQRHAPILVTEFAKRDPDGQYADTDGRWGYETLTGVKRLTEPGRNYSFKLQFDLDRPSPLKDNFLLDMQGALKGPAGQAGPVLRFKAVKWENGYT
ncbi:MAG TPA: hypothetical protein VFV57_05020 [Limnobacter sp.]|nr:hypothetical protein [Limnobacter sp.]